MKTNEEILERYLSEDSADFFNAQRAALVCLLPYEMAKPYVNPEYIAQVDAGTLPEDEMWEIIDPQKVILEFLPELYKGVAKDDAMWVMEGLMYMKSWIWVLSDELYADIDPLYQGDFIDGGREITDKIAKHFNYTPIVEDTEFEEIPAEESKDE